ncbi:MAG: hypothetical protein V3V08_10950 [Nannocystaceae bacterium]
MIGHRFTLTGFAGALCILAMPATARAGKDMQQRVGVGAQRTLSGANELHVNWFLDTRLSLGFGAGMDVYRDSNNGDPAGQSAFSFSPSVFGWFLRTKETGPVAANLGVGGRFTVIVHGTPNDTTVIEPILEIPVTVEVYLGQHFAIAPEAGLAFRMNVDGNTETFNVSADGGSGPAIMAGGSFHFYF